MVTNGYSTERAAVTSLRAITVLSMIIPFLPAKLQPDLLPKLLLSGKHDKYSRIDKCAAKNGHESAPEISSTSKFEPLIPMIYHTRRARKPRKSCRNGIESLTPGL
jgi:hypothetical protein